MNTCFLSVYVYVCFVSLLYPQDIWRFHDHPPNFPNRPPSHGAAFLLQVLRRCSEASSKPWTASRLTMKAAGHNAPEYDYG